MGKIIVLDLGSESMCAAIGDENNMDSFTEIDLQNITNITNWEKQFDLDLNEYDVQHNYHLLSENNKRSKRFLNKISLQTDVVENAIHLEDYKAELTGSHATLDFNKQYTQSLFRYYHREPGQQFLCNPKVLHIRGVIKAIPTVKIEQKEYKLNPDNIIKHIAVHVINNLILKAPQCVDLDLSDCKLILTFPNVYSLTHTKGILEFIREHSKIKNVEGVYESDAAIYASIGIDTIYNQEFIPKKEREQLKKMAERIAKARSKYFNNEGYNIVSIDIGKGTTDVSLFNIRKGEKGERDIVILARTGIAKAGNALDYIFANYFNDVLVRFAELNNILFKFDLINGKGGINKLQNEINEIVQKIIFDLKINIYRGIFGLCLNKKFATLVKSEYNLLEKSPNHHFPENSFFYNLQQLSEKLSVAVITENENIQANIKRELPLFFCRSVFFNDLLFFNLSLFYPINRTLTKHINEYVTLLGEELPNILRHNANFRSELDKKNIDEKDNFSNLNKKSFLIITGQASQFQPLKEQIIQTMQSNYDIIDNNVFAISGVLAKTICCIGGFFKGFLSGYKIKNPNELLMDYYIHEIGGEALPLPYKELNFSKYSYIFKIKNSGELWFSTILDAENYKKRIEDLPLKFFHGYVQGIKAGEHTISYVPKETLLKIGVQKIKLQSYGGQCDAEDIYSSVWPELLKQK